MFIICKHIGTEDIDYMVFDGTADGNIEISTSNDIVSIVGASCTVVESFTGINRIDKQNVVVDDSTEILKLN